MPRSCAHRRLLITGALVTVGLLVGLPLALAVTSLDEVADLFRLSRYRQARQALATSPAGSAGRGELRLWQQRLTTDPDQAVELALQIVRDRGVPMPLRLEAGIDGASLALARQQPDVAWQLLKPLLDLSPPGMPGEIYLLAGQSLRLAGEPQRAREMLASVRPDDPAFAVARALLGRIGLESGDHELALNYFELAARRVDAAAQPELLAGRWQALRLLGRDLEARDLANELLRDHAGSLAAMEVHEQLRREDDELAMGDQLVLDTADADTAAVADTDGPPVIAAGRYTVQLAAFRDRALALQFVARWRHEVPDLRILRATDPRGQPLFRVQTGGFVSRVQASTEARRIERALGLEGFVTESGE